MRNKIGQIRRIFFAAVLVFLLVAVIVTAEDVAQETSQQDDQVISDSNADASSQNQEQSEIISQTGDVSQGNEGVGFEESTEISLDLCAEVTCSATEVTCSDGSVSKCENSCISETGSCISCIPVCSNIVIEQNQTENETQENQTQINLNETIPTQIPDLKDRLEVQLDYPSKINRGEDIEIKALITNKGLELEQLDLDFVVPNGFEIIASNVGGDCDILEAGQSCSSTIKVKTLIASTGINQIKVVVTENE